MWRMWVCCMVPAPTEPETGTVVHLDRVDVRADRTGRFDPTATVGATVHAGEVLGTVDANASPELVRRHQQADELRAARPALDAASARAQEAFEACKVETPTACRALGRAAVDAVVAAQTNMAFAHELDGGLEWEPQTLRTPRDGVVLAIAGYGDVQDGAVLASIGDPKRVGTAILSASGCDAPRDVTLIAEGGDQVLGTVVEAIPQQATDDPRCWLRIVPAADTWDERRLGQQLLLVPSR